MKFKKRYWNEKDRYSVEEVIDDIVNGSPYYSSSGQLETLEGEVSDLKNLCQKLLTVLIKNEIMSGEELCELSHKYEIA